MLRPISLTLLSLCFATARAESVALIFRGDSAEQIANSNKINTIDFKGNARIHDQPTGWEMLKIIEREAAAGKKISAWEIVGHGLQTGPRLAPDNKNDARLTVEMLQRWVKELADGGKNPRDFFAPNVTVKMRCCYVGAGPIPRLLLDQILPEGATVISDVGFYQNNPLGVSVWAQQRVSTVREDYTYKDGAKGDRISTRDFNGVWHSEQRGILRLVQKGTTITGSFEGDKGEHWGPEHRKGGTISKGTLDLETGIATITVDWGDKTTGTLTMQLIESGRKFTGKWTWKTANGDWGGVRGPRPARE